MQHDGQRAKNVKHKRKPAGKVREIPRESYTSEQIAEIKSIYNPFASIFRTRDRRLTRYPARLPPQHHIAHKPNIQRV